MLALLLLIVVLLVFSFIDVVSGDEAFSVVKSVQDIVSAARASSKEFVGLLATSAACGPCRMLESNGLAEHASRYSSHILWLKVDPFDRDIRKAVFSATAFTPTMYLFSRDYVVAQANVATWRVDSYDSSYVSYYSTYWIDTYRSGVEGSLSLRLDAFVEEYLLDAFYVRTPCLLMGASEVAFENSTAAMDVCRPQSFIDESRRIFNKTMVVGDLCADNSLRCTRYVPYMISHPSSSVGSIENKLKSPSTEFDSTTNGAYRDFASSSPVTSSSSSTYWMYATIGVSFLFIIALCCALFFCFVLILRKKASGGSVGSLKRQSESSIGSTLVRRSRHGTSRRSRTITNSFY